MRALGGIVAALALAFPAGAGAEMTTTLVGGELRVTGGHGRDVPAMTVENELNGDPWFLVPGTVTVADAGACDADICHVSAVRRIVFALGGGNDGHFGVEAAGKPTEWLGGDGHDELDGTTSEDVLRGEAGSDTLGDDDELRGSDDVLDGGPGNDRLFSLYGDDRLVGGPGKDAIHASNGHDVVDAGAGNDRIWLFFGRLEVNAGAGNDYVRGGKGPDVIDCGPGRDTVDVRWGGRDRIRNCERVVRRVTASAATGEPAPECRAKAPKSMRLAAVLGRGIPYRVTCDGPVEFVADAELVGREVENYIAEKWSGGYPATPVFQPLVIWDSARTQTIRLKLRPWAARLVKRFAPLKVKPFLAISEQVGSDRIFFAGWSPVRVVR